MLISMRLIGLHLLGFVFSLFRDNPSLACDGGANITFPVLQSVRQKSNAL